jgi:flagellar protein FliS
MFLGQGYNNAARRYAAVDSSSKVEGATPHQLIQILFQELVTSIDIAIVALRDGDVPKANMRQTRALSILHALEASLDFEKGGDIATSLAMVYREARRRMIRAVAERDAAPLEDARTFIADIASAWKEIG